MSEPRVNIEIEAGRIEIEVFTDLAPRAGRYFLDLVTQGAYDGCTFYRSTTLGVAHGPRLVQGGPLGRVLAPTSGTRPSPARRLPLLDGFETTADSGMRHEAGVVSLARDLADTGHAIPEFFICLGVIPQLDFGGRREPDDRGFPAFGRVTQGLGLVEDIAARPTGGRSAIARLEGEILSDQVGIDRIAQRLGRNSPP